MTEQIKLIIVALIAVLFAFAAHQLLQSDASDAMQEYETLHQSLSQKEQVTTEERQQLEQLFRKINSEANIKAALKETLIRYSLFLIVLVPTVIIGARIANFKQDYNLYAAGIIFVAFILSGSVIIGAIMGTLFFIVSQSKKAPK